MKRETFDKAMIRAWSIARTREPSKIRADIEREEGKQAAAILVVRERGHWSGSDRWCDLRVDDHAEPVAELLRILDKVGFLKARL